MKWFNKIFLGLGLLGCAAGLVLAVIEKIELGTWGLAALVAGVAIFGVLISLPYMLKLAAELFDIEYDKEGGLKIREASKCRPQQDDVPD